MLELTKKDWMALSEYLNELAEQADKIYKQHVASKPESSSSTARADHALRTSQLRNAYDCVSAYADFVHYLSKAESLDDFQQILYAKFCRLSSSEPNQIRACRNFLDSVVNRHC